MNQGILVIAYKEPSWVERVIRRLGPDFSFFLHIDSKISTANWDRYRSLAERFSNIVFLTKQYKVNWGGFNYLRAILLLVEKAVESKMDYCHLISGQDYPVKSVNYFKTNLHKEQNYMEFFDLPTSNWKNGGFNRLVYYHFYDLFNSKTYLGDIAVKLNKGIQSLLPFKRKLTVDKRFYGGSAFWSLNKECLDYVIKFVRRNPHYLERFRFTMCPEELFFQTILLNSPLQGTIINDNRRYICWQKRHASQPAILDSSDFHAIMASETLFARKIGYPESEELVYMLDKTVHGAF